MRITSLVALGVLVCGAAFSAPQSETITYVDGNIAGISPHTGGTLLFSDDASFTFRTKSHTIKVPYSSIGKAELGATLSHSHDAPLYKVWALPKRVFPKKTETQYLTVDFKNEAGESRTMTLELAESSASQVLSTIDRRRASIEAAPSTTEAASAPEAAKPATGEKAANSTSGATKVSDADWWDQTWKTTRNANKWPQSGTVAAGGQE